MPLGATPSRWCVCQFHHFRTLVLLSFGKYNKTGPQIYLRKHAVGSEIQPQISKSLQFQSLQFQEPLPFRHGTQRPVLQNPGSGMMNIGRVQPRVNARPSTVADHPCDASSGSVSATPAISSISWPAIERANSATRSRCPVVTRVMESCSKHAINDRRKHSTPQPCCETCSRSITHKISRISPGRTDHGSDTRCS